MRRPGVRAALALALLLGAGGAAQAAEVTRKPGDLLDHLARDPLVVLAASGEDLASSHDALVELFSRLEGGTDGRQLEATLEGLDRRLGCSLRDDLLAGVGEKLVFVLDLPPVDELMASMTTPESAAQALLGRTGLLASVRDRRRFDDCLRELFEQVGTVATDEATGSVRVRLPLPGGGSAGGDGASGPPPVLDVHYAYRDDLFALGADPAWVSAALQPRPVGERLRDGEDFSRVFAHLDPDPDRLSYVNLPKLRGMVEASGRLEAAIASDGEARRVVDLLLDPRFTGTGLGATAVDLERGCRRTSFGPTSLSGGTAVLGVIAGTAIPNLLDATDRGRQKRSLADIRSVGTAVEMYAIDNDSYPSTDGRWVPVRQIEATLAPVYIRTLPTADAWGHPLTYWSDGQRYRIASPGKDGEMSRDWSGQADPGPTSSFDSDIVFADGSFVSWPEGRQQR